MVYGTVKPKTRGCISDNTRTPVVVCRIQHERATLLVGPKIFAVLHAYGLICSINIPNELLLFTS